MSRQVKIGCLSAAVSCVILVGVWAYIGIIRPARAVLDDLNLMATLAPMNADIANQDAFTPPPGGELTQSRLEAFSRIQETMKAGLGEAEYALLRDRALALAGMFDEDGERKLKEVSLKRAVTALDGLGPVLVRAKELQVSGLNREGFSLDEYRWVRESFYRALGFSRTNVYFEDFVANMKAGKDTNPPSQDDIPTPQRNKDLAALYSDSVEEWHPFLVFGL
jgi:hypothetical protein